MQFELCGWTEGLAPSLAKNANDARIVRYLNAVLSPRQIPANFYGTKRSSWTAKPSDVSAFRGGTAFCGLRRKSAIGCIPPAGAGGS